MLEPGGPLGSEGHALMMAGKFLLTFGLLLGFPLQQLWSLRREQRKSAAESAHRARAESGR